MMRAYDIPHTNLRVSRIGYGCGYLGGNQEALSADTVANAIRVINTAYDHGITLYDHGDVYESGRSETVFGTVLKRTPGLRNKIVIQTKCGYDPVPEPLLQEASAAALDLSHDHIVSAAEGSLKRLGIDDIDILLLHWPDALAEPDEIARAFDDLKRSGKVRYFGVSNYTSGQIELLTKSLHQPLVTNQIQIGLSYTQPIADGLELPRDESTHDRRSGLLPSA